MSVNILLTQFSWDTLPQRTRTVLYLLLLLHHQIQRRKKQRQEEYINRINSILSKGSP